jgi:hypothetical protein
LGIVSNANTFNAISFVEACGGGRGKESAYAAVSGRQLVPCTSVVRHGEGRWKARFKVEKTSQA